VPRTRSRPARKKTHMHSPTLTYYWFQCVCNPNWEPRVLSFLSRHISGAAVAAVARGRGRISLSSHTHIQADPSTPSGFLSALRELFFVHIFRLHALSMLGNMRKETPNFLQSHYMRSSCSDWKSMRTQLNHKREHK
jgi:hypothetical protein